MHGNEIRNSEARVHGTSAVAGGVEAGKVSSLKTGDSQMSNAVRPRWHGARGWEGVQAWLQGLSHNRACRPGLWCPRLHTGWAWEGRDGQDSVSLSDRSSGQCRLLRSSFSLDTPGLAGADLNLPSLRQLSSLSPKVFLTTPAEPGACQQGLPSLHCPTLGTQMHPDRRMPDVQPPRHSRWQASGS